MSVTTETTGPAWAVRDAVTAATRIFTKLRHDPASIVITIASPIALVLIFGYVFGSAIAVPGGGDYREFLVPGLFVMIAINVIPTMVGIARDAGRGVVDRFRSLPIARSAVPAGQAIASLTYLGINVLLMALCGLIVGWRVNTDAAHALAAFGLLLLFGFAFLWVGTWIGLAVGTEEAVAQLSILVLPVSMLSNVYVPTSGMPAWLRAICDWNPASAATTAVRGLLGNPNAPTNGAWPLEHPVLATVIWSVVLLGVFAPLTTLRYARS